MTDIYATGPKELKELQKELKQLKKQVQQVEAIQDTHDPKYGETSGWGLGQL